MTGLNMEALEARILEIVEDLTDQAIEGELRGTSFEEAGIDSLMALEMIVYLEREFGVAIEEQELGGLQTFGDLLDLAASKV